jgi:hypothetical protein
VPLGLILCASATVTAARADEIQVNYNLAAKKSSDPILIPATNTPVSLTGVQTQVGFRGVGQATILRVAPASFLEWVGMDIASGAISTPPLVIGQSQSTSTEGRSLFLVATGRTLSGKS